MDKSLTVCPENSPDRCTTITAKGQCVNQASPGLPTCPMHGRRELTASQRRSVTELYNFKFQDEVKEFAASGYMSLRAEVSVLRMAMQKLLQTCDTPAQVVLNIGPLSKLSGDIANILSTMDRINMNSGNLLGPEEIVQLANEIVQAISIEVTDADVLARLAQAIEQLVRNKFTAEQLQ